jgi:ferric-dicitrate binding protein FerR (iron transport regulator)
MQENYLAKWLNDELTEAELAEFKKSDAYATYRKIKETSSSLEVPEFDVDAAWDSLQQSKSKEQPKVFTLAPYKAFLRIAAVIAILLAGSFFYLSTLNETISTEYAENKNITLPDTSEVILNAESELAYSEKKWETNRNVNLKGEAYFKVAKGKKFTVATTQGRVTVLGTQFNVETRDNYFEVTCFEGLVSVSFNGKETKLPAGNSFLAINGKSAMNKATIDGKPSWLTNESSFRSIPLRYVLDELQRQFNINVSTENIDVTQLYTGSFSNENLELALKGISVPLQIKFKLEGNKVLFYDEKAP